MIFEKKVIIGSITSLLGLITAVVGVVAVFFPDLLNLQKDKIQELTIGIKTDDDVKQFNNFMQNRIKDSKIFKLEAFVCNDSSKKIYTYSDGYKDGIYFSVFDENKYVGNQNDLVKANYNETTMKKTEPLVFNNVGTCIDQEGKYVMEYAHQAYSGDCVFENISKNMNFGTALVYYFPINGIGLISGYLPEGGEKKLKKIEELCGENSGWGITTYAYFDKQDIIEGIDPIGGDGPEIYTFKIIDESDVKMKNY